MDYVRMKLLFVFILLVLSFEFNKCTQQKHTTFSKVFSISDKSSQYCSNVAAGCIKAAKISAATALFKVGEPIVLYVFIADRKVLKRRLAKSVSTYPISQFFPEVGTKTVLNIVNTSEIISPSRYKLTACCLCKGGPICTNEVLDWLDTTKKITLVNATLSITLQKGKLVSLKWSGPRCILGSKTCVKGIKGKPFKTLAKTQIGLTVQWNGTDANSNFFAYSD